jgi:four helix bundle protein
MKGVVCKVLIYKDLMRRVENILSEIDFWGYFDSMKPIKRTMGNFEELEVWQESKKLSVVIYKATNKGEIAKDFGLRDQIRRAAISVPSNITEGEESGFDKLSIRYFHNAKASLAELYTQILIAFELKLINEAEYTFIIEQINRIFKRIKSLIKYRLEYM